MAKMGEMQITVKPRVMVHVRFMPLSGTSGDVFRGDVALARVPVIGDQIEHDDQTGTVSSVTFFTDGSAPYVVAR